MASEKKLGLEFQGIHQERKPCQVKCNNLNLYITATCAAVHGCSLKGRFSGPVNKYADGDDGDDD
jgi:hypothetical protein